MLTGLMKTKNSNNFTVFTLIMIKSFRLICCSFFSKYKYLIFSSILYGSCFCMMYNELRVRGICTEYTMSKQYHTKFITF